MEGQPIRLLDEMGDIIFDEVLEAGDVLYVPPRLSHYGVAVGECLTFSFGFRRPNMVQILDEVADVATGEQALFSPLVLPQAWQDDPNLLTNESILSIKNKLLEMLNSPLGDDILRTAVAELVSKRQYELIAFEEESTPQDLLTRLQNGECVLINPASRFIGVGDDWYVNGEVICLGDDEFALFKKLIQGEVLTLDDIEVALLPALNEWVNDSWVILY